MEPLQTNRVPGSDKGRAIARDVHAREIQRVGAARAHALKEAEAGLDRIARLLPDAIQGGLTLTDIARISGVSRPTLYELRARYGGSTSDLQLAVLQTVASRPGVLGSDLARHVGRPLKEVFAVVQAFADQGFIDYEPSEGRPSEPVSFATAEGFDLLENWSFDDQVRDEQESG